MEKCIPKNIVELQLTKLVGWTHLNKYQSNSIISSNFRETKIPQTNLWNHHPGDQNSSHPVGAFGLQLTIEVQDFSTSSFHLKTLGLSWCIKGPTKMDQKKSLTQVKELYINTWKIYIYIYIVVPQDLPVYIYIYVSDIYIYICCLMYTYMSIYIYTHTSVVCMYVYHQCFIIHQPSTSKWGSRQPFYNYTNSFTHQNALTWVFLLWFPRWGVLDKTSNLSWGEQTKQGKTTQIIATFKDINVKQGILQDTVNLQNISNKSSQVVAAVGCWTAEGSNHCRHLWLKMGGPLQNWRFRTWNLHHS